MKNQNKPEYFNQNSTPYNQAYRPPITSQNYAPRHPQQTNMVIS